MLVEELVADVVFEDGAGLPEVVADAGTENEAPGISPSTSLRIVVAVDVFEPTAGD